MQMLYNSDSFAVVQFDVPGDGAGDAAPQGHVEAVLRRGGYEIVDKFARKEIFIEGALAESFKQDVQALIDSDPTEEEMDAYLGRFSPLMNHPLVMH
jgi:hypothetical protein